jgi:hypothetical protein
MNVNYYLTRPVNVKTKIDKKDKEEMCRWSDYRIGCDLCCNGKAIGIETNFCDLIEKDEFLLNDLCTIQHKWYAKIEFEPLYVCYDKKYFDFLNSIYVKIGALKSTEKLNFNTHTNGPCISNCSGLTSCFDDYNEENTQQIIICNRCLQWLSIMNPSINVSEIDPLKLFWQDALSDLFYYVEFVLPEDKDYVYKVFNIPDNKRDLFIKCITGYITG